MATISVPLPSDGQTADAADYNTPINTIVSEINGNLDNANIKSAAAIDGSKLADSSINLGTKVSTWDGWLKITDSWAYASATTITVPTDATAKYAVGDYIKFTQTSVKYFRITAVAATTLTVTGVTTETVANAAISDIYYAKSTPVGVSHAWKSWTPTWANLTIGSATVVAKYIQIGKTVHARISMTFAANTSISGAATFTLPVASATDYTSEQIIGSLELRDAGTAAYPGVINWASTTTAAIFVQGAAGTYVNFAGISSTVPFTWTTNDQMLGSFTYEVA